MNYMEIPRSEKAMDECGVFGFYNNNDIDSIALTHDALYGLQHRGQVSAGITVNNGGKFSTIKELGMVSEVFPQRVLDKLTSGKITVGHVRYTSNQSLDRAANQPLVLRYKEGSLAIASNGAITNFPEIRKELERGGAIFQSNSNAELMGYVIATERCSTDNLEDAVLSAMSKLKGAFSTVICAPSRLIGFIAGHLGFWGIGIGSDEGEIAIRGKARGDKSMIRFLVDEMKKVGAAGKEIFISHCLNEKCAAALKEQLEEAFRGVKVILMETRGLDSFYAERRGLIVGF